MMKQPTPKTPSRIPPYAGEAGIAPGTLGLLSLIAVASALLIQCVSTLALG